MSNIYYGKVDTNGKYEDLSEVIGLTIMEDTLYLLQPQGVIALYIGTSKPDEGGFIIYDNSITRFKLESGEKIYVKTFNSNGTYLNVSS